MQGQAMLLLIAIWGVRFFREGGFGNLWGAVTGEYVVA